MDKTKALETPKRDFETINIGFPRKLLGQVEIIHSAIGPVGKMGETVAPLRSHPVRQPRKPDSR